MMQKEVQQLFGQLAAQLQQPTERGIWQANNTYQTLKEHISTLPDSGTKQQLQQMLLQQYKRLCTNRMLVRQQHEGKTKEHALTILQDIETSFQTENYTRALLQYKRLNSLLKDTTLPGMSDIKIAQLQQHVTHTSLQAFTFRHQWNILQQAKKSVMHFWKTYNVKAAKAALLYMRNAYAMLPKGNSFKKATAATELAELDTLLQKGGNIRSSLAEATFLFDNAISHMPETASAQEFYVQGMAVLNTLPFIVFDLDPSVLGKMNTAYSLLLMSEAEHVPQRSAALQLAKALAALQDHIYTNDTSSLQEDWAHACTIAHGLKGKPAKMMRDLTKTKYAIAVTTALQRCTTQTMMQKIVRSCETLAKHYPEDKQVFTHLTELARHQYALSAASNMNKKDSIRRRISAGEP